MIAESSFVIFICGLTVSVVLLQANILGEMSFSETCMPVKTGCMFYRKLKYFSWLFSPNESQKISKYFCLLLVLVGCGTEILCSCQMRQGFQLSVISAYRGHFFSDWFENLEGCYRCEFPKWYCWILVVDVVLFCVVCSSFFLFVIDVCN